MLVMKKLISLFDQYRGLRRENYILFLGQLVTSLGSMVWPLLTLIMRDKVGMDATGISIALALFFVASIPASLLGGKLADRFDKKMNIIYFDLLSIVLFLVCTFLPIGIPTLVLMGIAALSQQMEGASYDALLADITPTEDRSRAYSLNYMGANLGLVLAPSIAGLLFENYLWLTFLISGLSIACSTLLIFFLVKDTSPGVSRLKSAELYEERQDGDSLLKVLKERPVMVLFLVTISLAYSIYSQSGYLLPLDLATIHPGTGAAIYGTLMSTNCLLVVLLMPLFTHLLARTADAVKMLIGNLFMIAGIFLFFRMMGHVPWYYAAMTVFTIGEVARTLMTAPYIAARVPASHRGRVSSSRTIGAAVLQTGLQLVIGRIYDHAGSSSAWFFVFGLCVLLGGLSVLLIIADRKAYPEIGRGE